jgi:Flp pilus assembly protein TadD
MTNDPLARARALYYDLDRADLAEQEVRRVLAGDPDSYEAHAILSRCLARRGRHAEALNAAREAVRLAPNWGWCHSVLGQAWSDQHQRAEAEAAFREALRLGYLDPYCFQMLGETVRMLGRSEEALEHADRGLSHDATHVGCFNTRALSLLDLGRLDEAATACETALAHNPLSDWTHGTLGFIRLKQGRTRDAGIHFQTALALNPMYAWAGQQLTAVAEMQARWLALKGLIAVQWLLAAAAVLTFAVQGWPGFQSVSVRGWLLVWVVAIPVTFAAISTPGFSVLPMLLRKSWRAVLTPAHRQAGMAVIGSSLLAVPVAAGVFIGTGGSWRGWAAALGLASAVILPPTSWLCNSCAWPWQAQHSRRRHVWYLVTLLTLGLYPFNLFILLCWLDPGGVRAIELNFANESRQVRRRIALSGAVWGCTVALPAVTGGSDYTMIGALVVVGLFLIQFVALVQLVPPKQKS